MLSAFHGQRGGEGAGGVCSWYAMLDASLFGFAMRARGRADPWVWFSDSLLGPVRKSFTP